MCGISGFYRWGEAEPSIDVLKRLWGIQETRGADASGVYFTNTEGPVIIKDAVKASTLIARITDKGWRAIGAAPFALFHARAQTQGDKKNNENNHPVFGFDIAVTHNGVIGNDDDLFAVYGKGERFAKVDSAAINLVLAQADSLEERLRYLTILDGSASFAAVVPDRPKSVVLGRLGHNEVSFFLDPINQILYWSSIVVVGRLFSTTRVGSLSFVMMNQLPANRIIVLNPGGPASTETFEVTRRPFVRTRIVVRPPKTVVSPNPTPSAVNLYQRPALPLPQASPVGSGDAGVSADSQIIVTRVEAKSIASQRAPTLPGPSAFSWNAHDLWAIHSQATKCTQTVNTAYGRWIFEKDVVAPKFKPFKGIKKWWKRDHNGGPLHMPVNGSPWDNKLILVPLEVTERRGTAAWIARGYICPWCGGWEREHSWIRREGLCHMCLIRALIPREGR